MRRLEICLHACIRIGVTGALQKDPHSRDSPMSNMTHYYNITHSDPPKHHETYFLWLQWLNKAPSTLYEHTQQLSTTTILAK